MSELDGGSPGEVAAALGLGALAGALLLLVRPPRGRPPAGLALTSLGLATCCLPAAVAPTGATLVAAYALLGLVNAPYTARAQVAASLRDLRLRDHPVEAQRITLWRHSGSRRWGHRWPTRTARRQGRAAA